MRRVRDTLKRVLMNSMNGKGLQRHSKLRLHERLAGAVMPRREEVEPTPIRPGISHARPVLPLSPDRPAEAFRIAGVLEYQYSPFTVFALNEADRSATRSEMLDASNNCT